MINNSGLVRGNSNDTAVFSNDGCFYLTLFGQSGMFTQVPEFAMNRNRDFWTNQLVHMGQFIPGRMSGNMNKSILGRNNLNTQANQLIL